MREERRGDLSLDLERGDSKTRESKGNLERKGRELLEKILREGWFEALDL